MKIIEIYLLLVNFLGILLTILDKKRAKHGAWRIRERTFFLVSVLGGSVGTYAAMRLFHHKTKHRRFMIGLPLLILIQIILAFAAWRWGWFSMVPAAN
jgi:uncharacterized membrane protein YsdA (DUF1294 family)